MHMKGGANSIYSSCFRDLFHTHARGTLKRHFIQKLCNRIQAGYASIDVLVSMFRLNTHTWRLKGRGPHWA